jgi:hypothetical protein
MTRRRAWRGAIAGFALAPLVFLIPGSPLYLATLFDSSGTYNGHSIRYWTKALDSSDIDVRREAISGLGVAGPDGVDAVPALSAIMLEDPDPRIRASAADALVKMAPASRSAAPALAQAVEDPELHVRMYAGMALFRLHADARPAVSALIRAIKDPNNQTNLDLFPFSIQETMVLALGRASAGTSEAVPSLSAALDGDVPNSLRIAVARAFAEIGVEARPAAPILRLMLNDNSLGVRYVARAALQAIGAEAEVNENQANSRFPDPELPEADRKYLWEIEHHGNVLVKHGFSLVAAALKSADGAALSRLLSADFTGADLRDPRSVRTATDLMQIERLEDAGQPPLPLTRATFMSRLLEFRGLFVASPPQAKLALMTLNPKVRGQLDGPWECNVQLRLHGEHTRGAPAEVVMMLRFELSRPTEELLSRPGWLRSASVLQVLTTKSSHYLFAEVGQQRGLDSSKLYDNWKTDVFQPSTGGIYVCDFDRDGILDVLVTDFNTTLYRGRADGSFEDVTVRYGLPTRIADRPTAAWVDIDGDGWDDLILAGRIYRNDQGKRFVDYTDRSNLRIPGDAIGIVVADYDRDGKLDLYLTRTAPPGRNAWLDARSGEAKGNMLFRNKGDWQFENVTRRSGTFGGQRSTFTAAWLDANNDGWPDLHVINEFGDGGLLINNGNGTFTEHKLADHPADFGSMGMAVGDIDNDGNIDIFCANMYSKAGARVIGNLAPDAYPPAVMEKMRRFVAGSQLHLNKGGLKFEQAGKKMQVAAVGWSYGACLADLDNDGWLDIYATAGYLSRDRNEPDG